MADGFPLHTESNINPLSSLQWIRDINELTEMSYESQMLQKLAMPTREEVKNALLRALLRHGGVVKEFGPSGQDVVDEIAGEFRLNERQKSAVLQTIYRKENRLKNANLWNRLLFRAADSAAKERLVSRPTQTIALTNKREWMLTEYGFDRALRLLNFPSSVKNDLHVKSFEVQKIVKKLNEGSKPKNYDPIDKGKKSSRTTRESVLRWRGFRQAIVEAYSYRCTVCGLKINSPDSFSWEVEAAHIVPNRSRGRDDIWNGLALCRLHHWAFDVGWFTLSLEYTIQVSNRIESLPPDQGRLGKFEVIRDLVNRNSKIFLPGKAEIYPDPNAIAWHRQNVFDVKP